MKKPGRLIGSGRTAEIYEWGAWRVLKLYRPGFSSSCRNELLKTAEIHRATGQGPCTFGLVEIGGRSGGIYERIAGKSMMNTGLLRAGKKLARIHAGLQQPVEVPLMTVKESLRWHIQKQDALTAVEKGKILHWLATLPEGNSLCHFDFHPDNIILTGHRAVVIDWNNACRGDPCADVARTCMVLRFGELPAMPRPARVLLQLVRKRVYVDYLAEYLRLTGADLTDIRRWKLPVMAARLNELEPGPQRDQMAELIRRRLSRGQYEK